VHWIRGFADFLASRDCVRALRLGVPLTNAPQGHLPVALPDRGYIDDWGELTSEAEDVRDDHRRRWARVQLGHCP
jgi:hypothetical protein